MFVPDRAMQNLLTAIDRGSADFEGQVEEHPSQDVFLGRFGLVFNKGTSMHAAPLVVCSL